MNYFVSDTSVTVQTSQQIYTVTRDHPRFEKITTGLRDGAYESEEHLIADIDQVKLVEASLHTDSLSIENGKAVFHGAAGDVELNTSLVHRMIHMLRRELPVDSLVRFLENLMENPSESAVFELFDFLEKNDLPITDDGCFLAYKKVGDDYYDLYSHTFSNAVGEVVAMPREEVNPDRQQTCSVGLHFASWDYMHHYGGMIEDGFRIMAVKINPRDVVSIPVDYNNAKGRCCRYEVVDELPADEFRIRSWVAADDEAVVVGVEDEWDDWDDDDEW